MAGYITVASDEVAQAPSKLQTVESGQILWDKKRHWKATANLTGFVPRQTLHLSAYYNIHGPKYYYTLITQGGAGWGDKDAFQPALRASNAPWHLVSHPVSTLVENRPVGVGITMIQYAPTSTQETEPQQPARPLLLHCNIDRWGIRHLMCATCPEIPAGKPAATTARIRAPPSKGAPTTRPRASTTCCGTGSG